MEEELEEEMDDAEDVAYGSVVVVGVVGLHADSSPKARTMEPVVMIFFMDWVGKSGSEF